MSEAMVLPERTVDLWTATYITGRCWYARLWAPTEVGPDERYDLAVGLREVASTGRPGRPEPGRRWWPPKVFVLEHKGVTVGHRVRIDEKQLERHLSGDAQAGGRLVYYVLPALAPRNAAPNSAWSTKPKAPYGRLPTPADLRLRGPGVPGFQSWAVLIHVEKLAGYLAAHGATPLIDVARLWDIRGAESLRRFLSSVADCDQGRRVEEMEGFVAEQLGGGKARSTPEPPPEDRPRQEGEKGSGEDLGAVYRSYVGTI